MTQHDIQQRLMEIDKFNQFEGRQDPTKPDPNLPIDPRTKTADNPNGASFTPNDLKRYINASTLAGREFYNQSIPGAPTLQGPVVQDAGPTTDSGPTPTSPQATQSLWDNIKAGSAATQGVSDPGDVTLGNQAVQAPPATGAASPAPAAQPDNTNPALQMDNDAIQSLTSGNQ